ncbi:hypothetical protein DOY81_012021 [Sarcophaga bullata]|nr:hypothetical protein DOY81_012021 [Sarcophaga bullata]
MFQRSAAQLLAPAIRNAVQRRCQSVISSPPTQKVSFAVSTPINVTHISLFGRLRKLLIKVIEQ